MYAPPKYEDIIPFIAVGQFLTKNKFFSPRIFAHDQDNGFILLEDFGNLTYNKFLLQFESGKKRKQAEFALYKKACDVLIELNDIEVFHHLSVDLNNILQHQLIPYNNGLLYKEVLLFVNWYLPLIKKEFSLEEKHNFKRLFFNLFDFLSKKQQVLVLRD
jgi:aminoglycoside/choline kinase family phosphotransferase